jgi:hypothetical protein
MDSFNDALLEAIVVELVDWVFVARTPVIPYQEEPDR